MSDASPPAAAPPAPPAPSSPRAAAPDDAAIPRIPALDGLRGAAVLAVFVFHGVEGMARTNLGERVVFRALRQGWVGVDWFFVLSGFLITSILLATKSRPDYYRRFFLRRTLRIFPLYYATLAVLFFVVPRVVASLPPGLDADRRDQLWFWAYAPHWLYSHRGHLGAASHFWSLGVEEQFYLVWPFVVRAFRPRTLAVVAATGVLGGLAVRLCGPYAPSDPILLRVIADYRIESPLAGACVAALAAGSVDLARRLPLARLLAAAACAVFVGATVAGPRSLLADAKPTLALLFGACVVTLVVAGPATGLASRLLASSPLRFFGRYSYALYVFHPFVLLAFDRLAPHAPPEVLAGSPLLGRFLRMACGLALTVVAALASWHVWEKRWIRLGRAG